MSVLGRRICELEVIAAIFRERKLTLSSISNRAEISFCLNNVFLLFEKELFHPFEAFFNFLHLPRFI